MTSPEDVVDVDELPDGPLDIEAYRRLVELVDPDRADAAGSDRQFAPPDLRGDRVSAFRFEINGESYIWSYCRNCGKWELVVPLAELWDGGGA